jgi:hypothetical protein
MFNFVADFFNRFSKKRSKFDPDGLSRVGSNGGGQKKSDDYDYTNDYVSPAQFMMNRSSDNLIIPDITVKNNVGKNNPTILIMEDFPGMVDLLYTELLRIQYCPIEKMFNIITATDEYAAFTVKEYLDRGGKIDIAFLDITLGGIKDGIELDGVDISLFIRANNPNAEIRFITGHTLNRRNPEIFEFMQKFYLATGQNIDEEETFVDFKTKDNLTIMKHIIGKNSNRIMLMALAIEKWIKKLNPEVCEKLNLTKYIK